MSNSENAVRNGKVVFYLKETFVQSGIPESKLPSDDQLINIALRIGRLFSTDIADHERFVFLHSMVGMTYEQQEKLGEAMNIFPDDDERLPTLEEFRMAIDAAKKVVLT